MPRKIVITGGPCSGKSSLLNFFTKKGFNTVSEVSRDLIKQSLDIGSDLLPRIRLKDFQDEILRRQKLKEDVLKPKKLYFLDRGVLDGLVFLKFNGINFDLDFWKKNLQVSYEKAFALEMLPEYKNDRERRESKEESQEIHRLLIRIYREFGIEVEEVPFLSIKERFDFLTSRIDF